MNKPFIKLAYRQVIDASCTSAFEENVFRDSFSEFVIQSQVYNPDNSCSSFHELVARNPKANSMHYKVGFAVGMFVRELNGIIPGLEDTRGRTNIPFATYEFEILESEIRSAAKHRVAIHYITDPLLLLLSAGDYLVLAPGARAGELATGAIDTFTLQLQPGLAVIDYCASTVVTDNILH
jgi:hypothetical protein